MASPIDYTSAFANIPSPQESFMQGVRDSATMQQLQAQRQQQAMALQQAEAARQQQIQMQNDLGALSQNPTSAGIAKFTTRYPHLSEPMKRAFDMLEPAEKQTQLKNWNQVSAAFETNHPEIAIKLMREQATALRNSKNESEAGAAEAMANLAEKDPVFAKILTGKMVATISGPEKYAEAMAKLGGEQRAQEQAPAALRKVTAEAGGAESDEKIKAVDAKYADSKAILDIEKKGWDVKKIKADIDIARESNRIAAMNAAANREGNTLKREELRMKIDDAKLARDDKIRSKVAEAETEISGVTDMKDLIGTILADPSSLKAVTGASAWKGAIPGTENRSMAGKVEQLVNMTAAINLDKLKGPMSDKDILFVKRISANLDRYQDEDVFEGDLKKLQAIAERTENKLREKYGVPAPAKPTPKPASDEAARVRAQADAILGGGNGNR